MLTVVLTGVCLAGFENPRLSTSEIARMIHAGSGFVGRTFDPYSVIRNANAARVVGKKHLCEAIRTYLSERKYLPQSTGGFPFLLETGGNRNDGRAIVFMLTVFEPIALPKRLSVYDWCGFSENVYFRDGRGPLLADGPIPLMMMDTLRSMEYKGYEVALLDYLEHHGTIRSTPYPLVVDIAKVRADLDKHLAAYRLERENYAVAWRIAIQPALYGQSAESSLRQVLEGQFQRYFTGLSQHEK